MSVSVTVTNTSSSSVWVGELCAFLGPTGASNAALTFTRSQAQLDSMNELKTLVHAGTLTIDLVPSADNEPIMSIPATQAGIVTGLAVDAGTVVTSAVTFPDAYHAATVPNVQLQVVQGAHTDFKATPYVRSVSNTGFTIAMDVTTAGAAGHVTTVHWTARK